MDSFSFHNLQAEKANAILKNRKLRRIASLLRFIEVCVVLVLISRLSLKLPVAVRNSSEYLRDLSLFMNSPRFVFLIGNVIIITLFAQSGHFSGQGSGRNVPEQDLYQEFVQKNPEKQGIRTEMKNYPENQGICPSTVENYRNQRIDGGKNKLAEEQGMKKTGEANIGNLGVKKGYRYRRCETEVLSKRRRVLRRCETEKIRKIIEAEEMKGISCPEDDISNEEFRCIVEAFIAKQQRIRREEEDCSLV
ncbi:hypothetical protein SESBI_09186 [Sesbania bispinosa]|nr:hypothetical protein SESBI_09186 [Sesbania bispinosa]